MPANDVPSKICASCGRTFAWRKAWERTWDDVRYCSTGCRRHRPGTLDRQLESAIVELLGARRGTICPSEAARRVGGNDWRGLVERTRRAARRLAASGTIVVTQQGQVVGNDFKGPIRLGRP
jgi:hypothetical protein